VSIPTNGALTASLDQAEQDGITNGIEQDKRTIRLYRERHVIKVRTEASRLGPWYNHFCQHDGLRVVVMKNGRYRHEPGAVMALAARTAGLA
jgi:hypothetical protein